MQKAVLLYFETGLNFLAIEEIFTTYWYISPISRQMESYDMEYHKYADGTQLYSIKVYPWNCPRPSAIQLWFWSNDLLLNPEMSDVAFHEMHHGLRTPKLLIRVTVAGCSIKVSDRLKILYVTFDASLTFESHINEVQLPHQSHIASMSITDKLHCVHLACSIVDS